MPARHCKIEINDMPDACREEWQALETTGAATPFQARAWLLPWYRIVAPRFGAVPILVTVRDKASGRPLMFLPLCRRRDRGLSIIEFPDLGVSDYNAPILAAGFAPSEREIEALWRAICRALPSADLIRLDKVPETILDRPNPMARLTGLHRMGFSYWTAALPPDRETFDHQALTGTFRKELRRKRRRTEGRGPVSFAHAATVEQARAILDALVVQRRQRFEELGRTNILSDPTFLGFYEAVIFDNWAERFGDLSALMVGDEIAATMLALRHRGGHYLLMSGFDGEKWKSCSPGNVMIDAAITALIGEGMRCFDFTIGDEAYKQEFGAKPSALYYGKRSLSLFGVPLSLAGRLKAMLRDHLKPALAARARRA